VFSTIIVTTGPIGTVAMYMPAEFVVFVCDSPELPVISTFTLGIPGSFPSWIPLPFVSSKTVPLTLPVGLGVGTFVVGGGVGDSDGDSLGLALGEADGDSDGDSLDNVVGLALGDSLGDSLGLALGAGEGTRGVAWKGVGGSFVGGGRFG
jgi:hypothetical protein